MAPKSVVISRNRPTVSPYGEHFSREEETNEENEKEINNWKSCNGNANKNSISTNKFLTEDQIGNEEKDKVVNDDDDDERKREERRRRRRRRKRKEAEENNNKLDTSNFITKEYLNKVIQKLDDPSWFWQKRYNEKCQQTEKLQWEVEVLRHQIEALQKKQKLQQGQQQEQQQLNQQPDLFPEKQHLNQYHNIHKEDQPQQQSQLRSQSYMNSQELTRNSRVRDSYITSDDALHRLGDTVLIVTGIINRLDSDNGILPNYDILYPVWENLDDLDVYQVGKISQAIEHYHERVVAAGTSPRKRYKKKSRHRKHRRRNHHDVYSRSKYNNLTTNTDDSQLNDTRKPKKQERGIGIENESDTNENYSDSEDELEWQKSENNNWQRNGRSIFSQVLEFYYQYYRSLYNCNATVFDPWEQAMKPPNSVNNSQTNKQKRYSKGKTRDALGRESRKDHGNRSKNEYKERRVTLTNHHNTARLFTRRAIATLAVLGSSNIMTRYCKYQKD